MIRRMYIVLTVFLLTGHLFASSISINTPADLEQVLGQIERSSSLPSPTWPHWWNSERNFADQALDSLADLNYREPPFQDYKDKVAAVIKKYPIGNHHVLFVYKRLGTPLPPEAEGVFASLFRENTSSKDGSFEKAKFIASMMGQFEPGPSGITFDSLFFFAKNAQTFKSRLLAAETIVRLINRFGGRVLDDEKISEMVTSIMDRCDELLDKQAPTISAEVKMHAKQTAINPLIRPIEVLNLYEARGLLNKTTQARFTELKERIADREQSVLKTLLSSKSMKNVAIAAREAMRLHRADPEFMYALSVAFEHGIIAPELREEVADKLRVAIINHLKGLLEAPPDESMHSQIFSKCSAVLGEILDKPTER